MHVEEMTHEELEKFYSLPASEQGRPSGASCHAVKPNESYLEHLEGWRGWYLRRGNRIPVWLGRCLEKFGEAASLGHEIVDEGFTGIAGDLHLRVEET